MKYHINGDDIVKISDIYKFTLLLDNFYYWNTINVSMSINNSIGQSPYSDYYTINGAINRKLLCIVILEIIKEVANILIKIK